MPDSSDVAEALKAVIVAALYPNGPAQPSTIGRTVRIFRGWPEAAGLAKDVAAGVVNVSIFERPNMSRDVTRYPTEWQAVLRPCTLTVAVDGQTATFGGTATVGQAAAALVGRMVYAYRIQAADTPATVATTLAGLIPGAAASGLSVTAALLTDARTGMDGLAHREVRRQQQSYMVTVWCADPTTRDVAASAVDAAVAGLQDAAGVIRPFITLPDGSQIGPVHYEMSTTFDKAQDAGVYRRDLCYRIEYPTLQTQVQPVMLFGGLVLPEQNYVAPGLANATAISLQGAFP